MVFYFTLLGFYILSDSTKVVLVAVVSSVIAGVSP